MSETKYPAHFQSKKHLIVSYDAFVNEQKHHLTMLYPFLSSDQIHGKLRSMWKHMNSKDKNNYCKVVSTLDKSLKGSRKKPLTFSHEKAQLDIGFKAKRLKRNAESSSNQQEGPSLSKAKKGKIASECESYTNDFIPSNSSYESSTKIKVSTPIVEKTGNVCREESDNCIPIQQKYTRNYIKARYRPDCDLRLVPDVIDNTPSAKSGILKNKLQNAVALDRTQKQLSVSFSGNDLDGDLATFINHTESSDEDNCVDSPKRHHDISIKKQNKVEEEKECPPETKCRDVTPKRKTKNRSKHTQSKKKGRCSRENEECDIYNFEDIDNYEMFIESACMKKDKNHSKPERCLKRSGLESDIQTIPKKISKQNDINPLFKSPKEKQIQSRLKQKGTLVERSDTKQVDSRTKRISSLETPALDLQIRNEEESETTPLMDEGLQRLTLQEASRAPNKRKANNYKANSESQAHRYEDMKERVTKSLTRKKSSIFSKADIAQIGEKGDVRIAKTDCNETSEKCNTFININAHKDSSFAILKIQKNKDKTVNAMQFDGKLMNSDDDADFDDFNLHDSDLNSPYYGGLTSNNSIFGATIRHSSLEIHSPIIINESGDNITEPVEMEEDQRNKQCERNDVLENALAKLRRMVTLSISPEVSSLSADSSPKLLSPALSGISELSSLSSERSLDDKTQYSHSDQTEQQRAKRKMTTDTQQPLERSSPICETNFQDLQIGDDNLVIKDDLCNMFQEVTPEVKKSLKDVRRLVASSKVKSKSNFTDLFISDEIF